MRFRTKTRPRDFREALIAAGALEKLFERLNAAIEQAGYLAMGGQIVDASIVEAPKQRNTKEEKAEIKTGRVPRAWLDKPHKLRQKDMDARWTLKRGRVRVDEDGREQEGLLIPAFGYKACPRLDRGTMSASTGVMASFGR